MVHSSCRAISFAARAARAKPSMTIHDTDRRLLIREMPASLPGAIPPVVLFPATEPSDVNHLLHKGAFFPNGTYRD
jgi:hypothetical protein